MFGNKKISNTISSQNARSEDAEFIGWQPNNEGEDIPLYNIIAPDHPLHGSTVSEKTLYEMNLQLPQLLPSNNANSSK